jgi:sterol desaturase/sphingolipid hydroxylase (fatty acid hydroxylase superfamily)
MESIHSSVRPWVASTPLASVSWQAYAAFSFILSFYTLTNYAIQLYFYRWGSKRAPEWKTQAKKLANVGGSIASQSWLPALNAPKEGRHPYHWALGTFNTLLASTFAGATAEVSARGLNKMYTAWPFSTAAGAAEPSASVWDGSASSVLRLFGVLFCEFLAAVVIENVLEYYWHRTMHLPVMYKRFHKIHHFYKSPEPFDDMLIHPLEAFGE